MGAIASLADLANSVFKWLVDPVGYRRVTREAKLDGMRDDIHAALQAGDLAAADRLFAEYRKLLKEART